MTGDGDHRGGSHTTAADHDDDLALIAGMFPVALGHGEGADFRAPLGRAIIGGVITSTFLTLLVIPTIYEILDDWRDRLLARLRVRGAHGAQPSASGGAGRGGVTGMPVPGGAPGD